MINDDSLSKSVLTLSYAEASVPSQKLGLVESIPGNIAGDVAQDVSCVVSNSLVFLCFGGPLREPDVASGLTTLRTARWKRQCI